MNFYRMKKPCDIVETFYAAKAKDTYLKVCAPMVRYSKLQFRTLIKNYGVDVCFSPMIMADSFCQSSSARQNEFTTSNVDTPLIVQFAAKTVDDFVGAAQLVSPYADGVDLNCGCPQRWAIKDGYGCALLAQPETIHRLVREFKNKLPSSLSVSVKIRLLKELKNSIELCRQLEKCGVTFLTIHGRTASQKSSEQVDVDSLAHIKSSLQVPLIANGGVKTLADAESLYDSVKCDGIMVAQGILTNPALFTGEDKTPVQCIEDWINICTRDRDRVTFQCYHHHLVFMLDKLLRKKQKQIFNNLNNWKDVDSFLENNFNLVVDSSCLEDVRAIVCDYDISLTSKFIKKRCDICSMKVCACRAPVKLYDSDGTKGNFFTKLVESKCDLDYMEVSLFDE